MAAVELSSPTHDSENHSDSESSSHFYAATPSRETITQYVTSQAEYMEHSTSDESPKEAKQVKPKPNAYTASNVGISYDEVSMDKQLGQGAYGIV